MFMNGVKIWRIHQVITEQIFVLVYSKLHTHTQIVMTSTFFLVHYGVGPYIVVKKIFFDCLAEDFEQADFKMLNFLYSSIHW